MTEDQKWQREIELERESDLRHELKNKRAGETPPSGSVNYLCWWYFDIKR